MTRLIDADALLEAINKKQNEVYYNLNHKDYIEAIANAPTVQQSEPFGYFKAEPFGWTDCAETDEGAIALYEAPTVQREGFVSVPIEPTYEMIGAVDVLVGKETRGGGCYIDESESIAVYKAMIQAAPKE